MKAFLFYFFIALFALSVQAALFKGIKPDSILVLVYFYSLRYGQIKGMTYGALTGLLVDFASGLILGPNIISKAFVGYFITSIRRRLFQWNVVINTGMVAIFSLLDILIVYVCLETFANISFVNRPLWTLIIQVVYTAVISLVLYPVLSRESRCGVRLDY